MGRGRFAAKGFELWLEDYGGDALLQPTVGCDPAGLTLPVKEYPHTDDNCSITGGYVYRGKRRPDLLGAYIYGDYCTGRIWEFRSENGQITSDSLLVTAPSEISSFGVDQDNELYVCGYSTGTIYRFGRNALTEGYNSNGSVPTRFTVEQNYPNPFNPSTSISYSLPLDAEIVLKVYDTLGREVATLVDGNQRAGQHRVIFDALNVSSGAYIYQLRAASFGDQKKMLLVK